MKMEEKIKLCNFKLGMAQFLIKKLYKEIDNLNRKLKKNKQICSVSNLLLLFVLIGFMLSLYLNTRLQRYNRVLSTTLDSVIYKTEQVMLISSKNKMLLDKHLKFKGLNNKEKKQILLNEKNKRIKGNKTKQNEATH